MKKNWIYLSYPLRPGIPAYGGGQGFTKHKDKQIETGDSCNTSQWAISSHIGTHLDFPRHFSGHGSTLDDYEPGFFLFCRIHIADLSNVEPGMIIGPGQLDLALVPEDTELLIIKTGFGTFRDKELYWQQNPGFHPDLADYFRENLKDLRIMGFDSISLSSFANRDLGRRAHRAFLAHDRPILPLEDMDLTRVHITTKINLAIIAPLLVSGADGAPCTVIARMEKE